MAGVATFVGSSRVILAIRRDATSNYLAQSSSSNYVESRRRLSSLSHPPYLYNFYSFKLSRILPVITKRNAYMNSSIWGANVSQSTLYYKSLCNQLPKIYRMKKRSTILVQNKKYFIGIFTSFVVYAESFEKNLSIAFSSNISSGRY